MRGLLLAEFTETGPCHKEVKGDRHKIFISGKKLAIHP
jgi:hypothetical protein